MIVKSHKTKIEEKARNDETQRILTILLKAFAKCKWESNRANDDSNIQMWNSRIDEIILIASDIVGLSYERTKDDLEEAVETVKDMSQLFTKIPYTKTSKKRQSIKCMLGFHDWEYLTPFHPRNPTMKVLKRCQRCKKVSD